MTATITTADKRTWGDTGGACLPVIVELQDCDCIVLTALTRHPDGRLENRGVLFIDFNEDAFAMARMTITDECQPPILADWIEDHSSFWRCPGEARDAAVAEICKRLRANEPQPEEARA